MPLFLKHIETARQLKPVQAYHLARNALTGYPRPVRDPSPAPGMRAAGKQLAAPVRKPVSMTGPSRFRFLNEEREIGQGASLLWNYNLHYHDDLNAEAALERLGWHRDMLGRWVRENPPGSRPGWEP